MSKIGLKQPVKKKRLLLIFFVLYGLFISFENGFAQKFDIRDYFKVRWDFAVTPLLPCVGEKLVIETKVYDYSLGPNKHQFLQSCTVEASVDNAHYFKLMEIRTPKQPKLKVTKIDFLDRLNDCNIEFDSDVKMIGHSGVYWPLELKNISVNVPNEDDDAYVAFMWRLDSDQRNIHYIRISGKWMVEEKKSPESFNHVVYRLQGIKPKPKLKTNPSVINTNVSKNETVNVFKESDEIVIKGAEPGTKINVYTAASGVEIKSVISNTDVVKIKLPVKKIYTVHVGKSEYKVAL